MKDSQTKEKILAELQSALINIRINISCLKGRTDIIKSPFYQVEALLQESIRICSQNSRASRLILQKLLIPLMSECGKNLHEVLKDSLKLKDNYDKLKQYTHKFSQNRTELLRFVRVYDPYAGNPTSAPEILETDEETNEKTESAKLPEVKIDVDRHRKVAERVQIIRKYEELMDAQQRELEILEIGWDHPQVWDYIPNEFEYDETYP